MWTAFVAVANENSNITCSVRVFPIRYIFVQECRRRQAGWRCVDTPAYAREHGRIPFRILLSQCIFHTVQIQDACRRIGLYKYLHLPRFHAPVRIECPYPAPPPPPCVCARRNRQNDFSFLLAFTCAVVSNRRQAGKLGSSVG